MNPREYKHLNDEEIIIHIRIKGEKELFNILFERYYQKVLDKCYSLIKNRGLAEDFANEIFSKVFEKIISVDNINHFSSWLYSVTYNYCIDYLRHKKRLHYPDWNLKNEIPEIPDESEENFSQYDYDLLLEVLDKIHPEEKALLIMKYQDNISMREIAKSLRISEDAAKMRMKRARTRVMYLYRNVTRTH